MFIHHTRNSGYLALQEIKKLNAKDDGDGRDVDDESIQRGVSKDNGEAGGLITAH